MAVAGNGEPAGSLSGGCVEGAVHEPAREVPATGRTVTESCGTTDQDVFAAGLTGGGEVDVRIRPLGGLSALPPWYSRSHPGRGRSSPVSPTSPEP